MRRIDTTIYCSDEASRTRPAQYKIAAEWTGGGFTELKTYGFADEECLERVYLAACKRMAKIGLSEGEKVSDLFIYRLERGRHDYELDRMVELEKKLLERAQALKLVSKESESPNSAAR